MIDVPELRWNSEREIFVWKASFKDRNLAKDAGFRWHENGVWVTSSPYIALNLQGYAVGEAAKKLWPISDMISFSELLTHSEPVPSPKGLKYLPFQIPGIRYAASLDTALIADSMGLGKTIQFIGVANLLKIPKVLIICPASLRANWLRELKIWFMGEHKFQVLTSGKQTLDMEASVITSYELAVNFKHWLSKGKFGLIGMDESHYLKNADAERTKAILGTRETKGLAQYFPRRILLSGTPIPNRSSEFYGQLNTLKPGLIDHMKYRSYERRFCIVDDSGKGSVVTGSKNEKELYNRLRSGFMVRRLKKDVLKDLPGKSYKLVVFPSTAKVRKIVQAEKPFSAEDILAHGVPAGSCLPKIRHEIGLEMVTPAVKYIKELLDEVDKVLVFTHHIDVSKNMKKALKAFNPVMVIGETKDKQGAVDTFQLDHSCRVLIGSTAAGVGFNMTAASEVVLMEPSYVPSMNEQQIDRAHRIGQKCKVNIHYLVIEGTLGSKILSKSLSKQRDLDKILDGV